MKKLLFLLILFALADSSYAIQYTAVSIASNTFGAVDVDSQTPVAVPSAFNYKRLVANYANMSSTSTVFFSTSNVVTALTGFPLFSQGSVSVDLDPLAYPTTFYFIRNSGEVGSISVRFWNQWAP